MIIISGSGSRQRIKSNLNELRKRINESDSNSEKPTNRSESDNIKDTNLPVQDIQEKPVDKYFEALNQYIDSGKFCILDVNLGNKAYEFAFIAGHEVHGLNKYHLLGINDEDTPLPRNYTGDSTYISKEDNDSLKSVIPCLNEIGLEVDGFKYDKLCKYLSEDSNLKLKYTSFIVDL